MSHDLEIVVNIKPDHSILEDFSAARKDLSVQGRLGSETDNVVVYRKRGEELVASFEVWGPSRVEPEDLEEQVAALVPTPRWMIQISVPAGGEGDDIPDAEALARRIAEHCKGVVFDPQIAAVVWPKKITARRAQPRREETIRVIKLSWYLPRHQASLSMARSMLQVLREVCREAVPRRFGSYEPLQGRMELEEDDPFLKAFQEECMREVGGGLFFKSRSPCFGGHIFTPHKKVTEAHPFLDVVKISLSFDGRILHEDASWSDRVALLFAEIAERLEAFYGHAYVERGVYASRGGLSYGGDSEIYPLPRGRWVGIPSTPTWLVWFGGHYRPLVEKLVESSEQPPRRSGILIRRGLWPMDLDELQGMSLRLPDELVAKMEKKVKEIQMKASIPGKPSSFQYVDWESIPAKFVPALD